MSKVGFYPLLLLCLLSSAGFVDADCDETACNVGTSVGVGTCAVASAVGGAALCVVTFGIGCGLAVAAGPLCAGVGAAIQDGVCSNCGSGELGFEDVVNKLGGLEDNVEDGFASLEDGIANLGDEINQWFTTLSENDKKLVEGQAKLIFLQKQGIAKLETLQDTADEINYNLQLAQYISLYGQDISNIERVINKFDRMDKGNFGIIQNNHRVKVFTELALDPSSGLEVAIDNVFAMMIGGHVLKRESIYEAVGKDFCRPEPNQYLLMMLNNALALHATAMAMEGRKISTKLLRDFRQNMIRASQAYQRHCGLRCPEGHRETQLLLMKKFWKDPSKI